MKEYLHTLFRKYIADADIQKSVMVEHPVPCNFSQITLDGILEKFMPEKGTKAEIAIDKASQKTQT